MIVSVGNIDCVRVFENEQTFVIHLIEIERERYVYFKKFKISKCALIYNVNLLNYVLIVFSRLTPLTAT